MEANEFRQTLHRRGMFIGPVMGGIFVFLIIVSLFTEDGFDAVGWSITGTIFAVACIITLFEYLYKEDGVYLREQELEVVRFRKVKKYSYDEIQHFSIEKKWRLASASRFFISFQQEPRFKLQLANGEAVGLPFEATSPGMQVLAMYIQYSE